MSGAGEGQQSHISAEVQELHDSSAPATEPAEHEGMRKAYICFAQWRFHPCGSLQHVQSLLSVS